MPIAAQLIDATKKYGSVQALKGISLDIDLGDVVAMLGPNGAGKTTSISLLLGLRISVALDEPGSGSISTQPADVSRVEGNTRYAGLAHARIHHIRVDQEGKSLRARMQLALARCQASSRLR